MVRQLVAIPLKSKEELFESQAPAIRQVDKQAMVFFLSSCIGDYLSFVGLRETMSKKQTEDTAQLMIEIHPNLQVDALKLFFNNCKRGIYGKHYNRMDGSVILQWFDAFYDKFIVEREEADYQKHLASKEDVTKPVETDECVDIEELYAAFHGGKTREEVQRDEQIKEIRLRVINRNSHLYGEMSPQEADEKIEQLVIEEMQKENLITF